jgi:hypothetical protein
MWKHIKDNNDLLYHHLTTRFRFTELSPGCCIEDDPALSGPCLPKASSMVIDRKYFPIDAFDAVVEFINAFSAATELWSLKVVFHGSGSRFTFRC